MLEQIGKDPSVHTERGGDVELLAELAREGIGAELRAESESVGSFSVTARG